MSLRFRRLPRTHLQTFSRRKSSRRSRQIWQTARPIRLDSRDRLPLRGRTLHRRTFELANPETHPRAHSLAEVSRKESWATAVRLSWRPLLQAAPTIASAPSSASYATVSPRRQTL